MLEYADPKNLLEELRERHVYDLDRREQELLAYLWFGHLAEEVAILMGRSPERVRAWYARLEHRVLDLTTVPPCARYLRTWVGEHLVCCARATKEMIENARSA